MKANKRIVSAIAAISVLSAATGITAFAGNLAEKNDTKPETETVISQEAEETTTEENEEVEAPTVDAEKPADQIEPPVIPEVDTEITEDEKPADEVETPSDSETDTEITEDEDAAKPEKPAKKIGKHEILEMIGNSFDFELDDFKDADAKLNWFEFCKGDLKNDLEKPENLQSLRRMMWLTILRSRSRRSL